MQINFANSGARLRKNLNEVFLLESHQCISNGRLAHTKLMRNLTTGENIPRFELNRYDLLPEQIVKLRGSQSMAIEFDSVALDII